MSGLDELHRVLDQGRGVLLFGAHLGSFEVMRVLARQRPEYVIRGVLDKAHNPAMTQMLDALDPVMAAGVIDAGMDGSSVAMAIKQATDQGALVACWWIARVPATVAAGALPRPRCAIPDRAVADRLCPAGAGGAGVRPVSRRQSLRSVVRTVQRFGGGAASRARPGPAGVIRRYAARLEHHARNAPYNWFNFYDFWGSDDERKDHSSERVATAPDDPVGGDAVTAPHRFAPRRRQPLATAPPPNKFVLTRRCRTSSCRNLRGRRRCGPPSSRCAIRSC